MRNEILQILDKHGRMAPEDIAAMLGANDEDVKKEIAAMEEEKVICGYPTLINWDKTDCEKVSALIEVKVTPQRGLGFDKIAERIYKYDEVESVSLISGSKLAPIESVLSTSTNFVLKKYKQHGLALTDEKSEDERMLITP